MKIPTTAMAISANIIGIRGNYFGMGALGFGHLKIQYSAIIYETGLVYPGHRKSNYKLKAQLYHPPANANW